MNVPGKLDIIKFYIKQTLQKVNQEQAISDVRKRFRIGEEQRSLKMSVVGVGDMYFIMGNHQILMPDNVDKPTATVTMLEDTFIKLKTKKLTFDEAYWYSQMDIQGDFWLRDLVIFREVFRLYGDDALEE